MTGTTDPGQQPRLVLVEDDARSRSALKKLLEFEGFLVEAFENAGPVLERLAAASFQALVTDHMMPGTTGLDLALLVRQRHPSVRCIVVSGTNPPVRAENAQIPWLSKPVDLDALVALLRSPAGDFRVG